MLSDIHTRNFHHPDIANQDDDGHRILLGNRCKLLVRGLGAQEHRELFNVRSDPGEKENLIASKPEVANQLQHQLRHWQESVLQSLTGADYE